GIQPGWFSPSSAVTVSRRSPIASSDFRYFSRSIYLAGPGRLPGRSAAHSIHAVISPRLTHTMHTLRVAELTYRSAPRLLAARGRTRTILQGPGDRREETQGGRTATAAAVAGAIQRCATLGRPDRDPRTGRGVA